MATLLEIKVVPQSGRQHLARDKSGTIKCFLKSPPEDGKANEELVKFLSKKLNLPQNSIKILQGATSRNKVLKIEGPFDQSSVLLKLGLDLQLTI
jgi:uncharacterized protein (TIGR00251 family)